MGDQVSIQGNGYVNNCKGASLWNNLNILSLDPCFKDFKTNGDAGNVWNVQKCSQKSTFKIPQRNFFFRKCNQTWKTELWAWHIVDSVSTVCICHHPSARLQKPQYLNVCITNWNAPQDFFLMQEAFQDHTALQLAMEWVMRVYSSHWYQPQSFALLFWGVKFAIFMFKYYNMVLQNKFQPDVDRKYDSPEWGQRQTYNPQVGYLWWLVRVFVLWREPLMFCPTI